jgi:trehalose 6-phosphate synthase/phosphatase
MTPFLFPQSEWFSSGCFLAALITGQFQPLTWTAYVLPRPALFAPSLFSLCQLAPRVIVCLDYDAVLFPQAPHPEEAQPAPALRTLVSQLAQLPATDVIVLSGRPLDQLTALLPAPGFAYISTHGMEMRSATGETLRLFPEGACTTLVTRLKHDMAAAIASRPGCVVEDQRHAIALHHRLAYPEDREWAVAQTIALVTTYQRKGLALDMCHRKHVLEVRPRGFTKEKALQTIAKLREPPLVVLYIGADETDQDAFQMVNGRGLTLCVTTSSRRTYTRYTLSDPEAVRTFLTHLLQVRRTSATRGAG